MTQEQFELFRNGKVAVNCKTEELAKEFVEYCHENGIVWSVSERHQTNWKREKENMCYNVYHDNLGYSGRSYFESERYQIIEFTGFKEKTLYEEILPIMLKRFDLELDEEFMIEDGDHKYKFSKDLLMVFRNDERDWDESILLEGFIREEFKIIKLPKKPRYMHTYMFADITSQNLFSRDHWVNTESDNRRWDLDLVRETEEECIKKAEEILKLMKK